MTGPTMIYKLKLRLLLPLCIACWGAVDGFAQCNTQITHGSGTVLAGGSNITVTSSGQTNLYNSYCPTVTAPYFIGYNFSTGNGPGSFTFNFSPAVSGVRLNFSGASNSGSSVEEIRLTVNGAHYAMPSVGTNNGCDAMASLTAAGDLVGCPGCGVSGWSNTTISSSISSLVVEDFIVAGTPNGALFSLFICNVILPAEWLSFEATALETGHVNLDWTTSSEINNDFFILERSWDAANWTAVDEIDAVGNSDAESDYSYLDLPLKGGQIHYRIKQVNMDGTGSYSDIQTVSLPNGMAFNVFPNPAEGTATLILPPSGDLSNLKIYNSLGQAIDCRMELSGNQVELDLANFPEGIYLVELMVAGEKLVQKLQVR